MTKIDYFVNKIPSLSSTLTKRINCVLYIYLNKETPKLGRPPLYGGVSGLTRIKTY